jgi:hypothetical protein
VAVRYPGHEVAIVPAGGRVRRRGVWCGPYGGAWAETGLAGDAAASWWAAGLRPCCAPRFAEARLGPADAARWTAAGFGDAQQAAAWLAAVGDPDEAKGWLAAAAEPNAARAWRVAGLTPEDVLRWRWLWRKSRGAAPPSPGPSDLAEVLDWQATGMTMPQVRLWVRAGMTPADAKALPPGHPNRPGPRALRVLAALRTPAS